MVPNIQEFVWFFLLWHKIRIILLLLSSKKLEKENENKKQEKNGIIYGK